MQEAIVQRPAYSPRIRALMDKPKEYLVPSEVAPILGWDTASFRYVALTWPERLPFPVITRPGSNYVKIPKQAFLRGMGYV